MVSRIPLAVGLLVLLAPALEAQAATETTSRMRVPRLVLDSALFALLPAAPRVAVPDVPLSVSLRFDPFTNEGREAVRSTSPSSHDLQTLPACPMPVQRIDSVRDSMPVARPDSTTKYFILVEPPGCVAEAPR